MGLAMYQPKITSISKTVDRSRGQLMSIPEVVEKADVSEATVKRIIQGGYVVAKRIGGVRYIYYRDFLRGAWEYEQAKERPGRKYANADWND